MLLVLCHHLNAIVLVENNHLQGVGCHQLEGDEVPKPDLVNKGRQPLSRVSLPLIIRIVTLQEQSVLVFSLNSSGTAVKCLVNPSGIG